MAYSRHVYKREAEAAERVEEVSEQSPTPTYKTHIFGHHKHHSTSASRKFQKHKADKFLLTDYDLIRKFLWIQINSTRWSDESVNWSDNDKKINHLKSWYTDE